MSSEIVSVMIGNPTSLYLYSTYTWVEYPFSNIRTLHATLPVLPGFEKK